MSSAALPSNQGPLRITRPDGPPIGDVALERSKSLSNRALIVQALCPEPLPLAGLSQADDTRILGALLQGDGEWYDCGHGGTTLRFLAALLAFREGRQLLTGSERLCQRPIAPLVETLRLLGADIRYAGREGFPPLDIRSPRRGATDRPVAIEAGISSQFISALLLVGPTLPEGLRLELRGKVASEPYVRMTTALMAHFGAPVHQSGHALYVPPGVYRAAPLEIEADWSGASYFLSIAALAPGAEIRLHGLRPDSFQGDSVAAALAQDFGVSLRWEEGVLVARNSGALPPEHFRHDFSDCPDLAQTFAALCAGKGIDGQFAGLGTLALKETDRTAALQIELAKFGYGFSRAAVDKHTWTGGRSGPMPEGPVAVETYEDHRMALCLAPLCLVAGPVDIDRPAVVDKSFPGFWRALSELGFSLSPL